MMKDQLAAPSHRRRRPGFAGLPHRQLPSSLSEFCMLLHPFCGIYPCETPTRWQSWDRGGGKGRCSSVAHGQVPASSWTTAARPSTQKKELEMSSDTTLVLVHGAWADGSSWRKVIDAVEA